MNNSRLVKKDTQNDCDFLMNKVENTFEDLGDCFETITDERKSKMNVIGSIFKFGFSLTKLTFNVAGCTIKNTPKAVVAVASVKREITTEIENGWNTYQKELKEDALNEKIQNLKYIK